MDPRTRFLANLKELIKETYTRLLDYKANKPVLLGKIEKYIADGKTIELNCRVMDSMPS